jgi:hypothetical protein
VTEASIGIQIGGVGRVDSLWIGLVGNVWGREWTLYGSAWLGMHGEGSGLSWEPQHKRGGALVGSWIVDTSSETSVGMRKLVETIEQPFIDVITDTQKCVKGIPSDQWKPS